MSEPLHDGPGPEEVRTGPAFNAWTILGVALILFAGAWLGWSILDREAPPAGEAGHGHGHGHQEAAHEEPPRGPHGGKLFSEGSLQAEVTIFESGVPPEFRIFFYRDGQPLDPAEVDLTLELQRLGQELEVVRFEPREGYLLGDTEVIEPHSFDVTLLAEHGGREYRWSYSQVEGRTEMAAEAAERAGVVTAVAGPVRMRRTLALPGQVALNADRVTHVVPPLSGIAGQVAVSVGDRVQQGDPLLVVQARDLADLHHAYLESGHNLELARAALERETQLRARIVAMLEVLRKDSDLDRIHQELQGLRIGEAKGVVLGAFAELKLARERLDREALLLEKQISTRSAHQAAQADYEAARARYAGALEEVLRQGEFAIMERERDLEVLRTAREIAAQKLEAVGMAPGAIDEASSARYVIRAPITGTVIERDVVDGESLDTRTPILKIADLSTVWVEVTIPAADLASVHEGQAATVETQGGEPLQGRLGYVGAVVGQGTQSARGRIVLPNPGGRLRPGLFATVTLATETVEVPLAVRESALQTFRDWDVVFLREGDLYEVRPLELGARSDGWVEVLAGLSPGDVYVAEGSYVLKADVEKSGATHDH